AACRSQLREVTTRVPATRQARMPDLRATTLPPMTTADKQPVFAAPALGGILEPVACPLAKEVSMRPAAAKLACLLAGAAIIVAVTASDVRAQSGRALGGPSYSGNLRQNYAGSQASGRLPFSASGAAGFGGRGGIGPQGRLGGGMMGVQSTLQQAPLNANLAQAGAERFQQGGFVGRDAEDVRQGFESQGRRSSGQMFNQTIENL